ncbi:MAG: hypothetical protein M1834_004663 [Cirrosporium novae-zelandiae]|nr:MAG: hypothetical protein M1834_004663 [Cirrosporium novae-zelandiae]
MVTSEEVRRGDGVECSRGFEISVTQNSATSKYQCNSHQAGAQQIVNDSLLSERMSWTQLIEADKQSCYDQSQQFRKKVEANKIWRMEGVGEGTSGVFHGQKRLAEDELNREQRLAKRFHLLSLSENDHLYIPQSPASKPSPPPRSNNDDTMLLDDTKDKIYIYNLDDELADVESEDEKIIFLPDIERKLNKIPRAILKGTNEPQKSTDMILYHVPESLSVPQGQDNVRKAIIETRARIREKQAAKIAALELQANQVSAVDGSEQGKITEIAKVPELPSFIQAPISEDPDAMDIE